MLDDGQIKRVIELRIAGKSYREIERIVGVSHNSARHHCDVHFGRKKPVPPKPKPTDEQIEQIKEMTRAGLKPDKIAVLVGCSRGAARHHAALALGQKPWAYQATGFNQLGEKRDVPPPAHVIAERDARINRAPRDLTAAFFGDPLPGYSALERR